MTQTKFISRLKKAAALQAEKKKAQQERFKALMEKLNTRKRPNPHAEEKHA